MTSRSDSRYALRRVDELLAVAGLAHGRRQTLSGTWQNGERKGRAAPSAKESGRRAPEAGEVVRITGWGKYPWLRHGFSTRSGGCSTVYGGRTMNLGWTREDAAESVLANRRRFSDSVWRVDLTGAGATGEMVGLRQIHSSLVRVIERDAGALLRAEGTSASLVGEGGRPALRGDALMTDAPGVLLAVGAADCVPVLVADVRRRVVAAFHAGWRGTLARIVERGIGRMQLRYGSKQHDLIAAIGPSIGPCCYSVGEELRFDFESQFSYASSLFTEVYDTDPVRDKYPLLFLTARAPGHSNIGPQSHLNLWEANRRQLLDAGVSSGRIFCVGECTACTRTRDGLKYFSHRGESGFAGRGLGAIGISAEASV